MKREQTLPLPLPIFVRRPTPLPPSSFSGSHSEAPLGLWQRQVVKYGDGHGGRELLGGEAVAAADHHGAARRAVQLLILGDAAERRGEEEVRHRSGCRKEG